MTNNKYNPWDEASETHSDTGKTVTEHPQHADEAKQTSTPRFNTSNNSPKSPQFNYTGLAISPLSILFIALLIWLGSGVYRVATHENAAVFYLGKFVEVVGPGLHYHLPYPLAYVAKRGVSIVNKEEFSGGTIVNHYNRQERIPVSNYLVKSKTPTTNKDLETLMLTGDENLVDIDFEVQWRIADLKDYLLNLEGAPEALREASISAMREVIGTTPISGALSSGKADIEERTRLLLQNILDQYQSGIEITLIQLLRVDPPSQVINSFRDIQTAKADKESSINEAESYYNDIVPKARGEAEQIIQEAEGYKQKVIADAEGKTSRFLKIYQQYLQNKAMVVDQLYLETMETVFANANVTILDDKTNQNLLPHLSVDKKNNRPRPAPKSKQFTPSNTNKNAKL